MNCSVQRLNLYPTRVGVYILVHGLRGCVHFSAWFKENVNIFLTHKDKILEVTAFCGKLMAAFCGKLMAAFCGNLMAAFCGKLITHYAAFLKMQ
jgi:hypothetical protein